MKKRDIIVYLILIILAASLTGVAPANAESGNLFIDDEETFMGLSANYDEGVLSNGNFTGSIFISVPGLTKNYTFKGHIKIVEIGSQPWNGVRIIAGADSFGAASKFVITKDWDTRVEFKNSNLNDLMGPSPKLNQDTEFDFELVRTGQHYVLKINGTLCLEDDIPEDLDAFEDSYEFNLGFESSECYYEASNFEVYCDDVVITPTPEPATPSPVPDETDKPADTPAVTVTPIKTTERGTAADNKISPVIIGICITAAIAIILVAIYIIKGKKNRKQR